MQHEKVNKEIFNCKKCGNVIGSHNQYLHEGMCDNCYFNEYFPDDAQIFETNINKIKKGCKRNKKNNLRFYNFIKNKGINQEEFTKILNEVTEKIDCTACANCCKEINPILKKKDIGRILKKLKIGEEEFLKKYTKSDKNANIVFNKMPCPFLKENKCQIYDSRPDDCKNFPNLDKSFAEKRIQFFSNAENCPIVFNVLENSKQEFLEDIYAFENPIGG